MKIFLDRLLNHLLANYILTCFGYNFNSSVKEAPYGYKLK